MMYTKKKWLSVNNKRGVESRKHSRFGDGDNKYQGQKWNKENNKKITEDQDRCLKREVKKKKKD